MSNKETILITGCGGYVGNTLVRTLLNNGYKVRGVDNFHKGQCDALLSIINNKDFEFQYGDVTSKYDCCKIIEGVDGIIHLAAIVGFPACKRQPALSRAVNYEGTRNIIEARNFESLARTKRIPLVFASTGSVYGKVDGICTEDSETKPLTIYGIDKLAAEKAVSAEEDSVSLRFATGFGISPCMRVNLLVNDLVYQAVNNRCLTIFEANARRTFISVHDMSYSFMYSYEGLKNNKLSHKVYNAGANNLNWTKRELAEHIKEKTGCLVTYAEIGKDLDQRDYEVDYSRFEKEIYVCQKSMTEGIEELLKATPLLQIRHQYE